MCWRGAGERITKEHACTLGGEGLLKLKCCLHIPWVRYVVEWLDLLHYSLPLASAVTWVFITWTVVPWVAAEKVCVTWILITSRPFSKWQIKLGLKHGMSAKKSSNLEMFFCQTACGWASNIHGWSLSHLLAWTSGLSIPSFKFEACVEVSFVLNVYLENCSARLCTPKSKIFFEINSRLPLFLFRDIHSSFFLLLILLILFNSAAEAFSKLTLLLRCQQQIVCWAFVSSKAWVGRGEPIKNTAWLQSTGGKTCHSGTQTALEELLLSVTYPSVNCAVLLINLKFKKLVFFNKLLCSLLLLPEILWFHNNLETVSLSPDVCSDSFVIAATRLDLVASRDAWKLERRDGPRGERGGHRA